MFGVQEHVIGSTLGCAVMIVGTVAEVAMTAAAALVERSSYSYV